MWLAYQSLLQCIDSMTQFCVCVAQAPSDGTVTVTLQPGNSTIGTTAVVPNAVIGASTATITRPFIDGATYGYGTQAGAGYHPLFC